MTLSLLLLRAFITMIFSSPLVRMREPNKFAILRCRTYSPSFYRPRRTGNTTSHETRVDISSSTAPFHLRSCTFGGELTVFLHFSVINCRSLSQRAAECDNCTVSLDANSTNSTTNGTNETVIEPEPVVYERVLYKIFFPHTKCQGGSASDIPRPDQLNVSLPTDTSYYTLQEVMEAATDQDESYQFSLLYPNEEDGYLLEGINGTDEAGDCRWFLYYQGPGEGEPTLLHDSATSEEQLQVELIEVEPNSTVVLCYQDTAPVEPVIEPSSSVLPSLTSSTSTTSSSSSSQRPTEPSTSRAPASSQPPTVVVETRIPTMTTGSASQLSSNTHALSLVVSIAILCLYHV